MEKPTVGSVGPARKAGRSLTRRDLLAGTAGAAAVGSLLFMSPRAAAQSSPTGVFPQSSDDPLQEVRSEQLRFYTRSSDPSSRPTGLMWFNDSV
jgi:hypothetical protein